MTLVTYHVHTQACATMAERGNRHSTCKTVPSKTGAPVVRFCYNFVNTLSLIHLQAQCSPDLLPET